MRTMRSRSGERAARSAIGALALAALAGADARAADPEPPSAERIVSPGRSVVAEDSAEAIVLNPANLA